MDGLYLCTVLSAISSQFRRLEESENGVERKSSGGMNRPSVWTIAVSLATMRVSTHSSRQGDGDVIIPPARLSVRLFRRLRFHPGQTLRPPLALAASGDPPGQGPAHRHLLVPSRRRHRRLPSLV